MNFSVIVHDKPIHRRAYDAIILILHCGEFIIPRRQVRMNRARAQAGLLWPMRSEFITANYESLDWSDQPTKY